MDIDALDLYAVVVERLGDALFVAFLLLLVDAVGAHGHVGQQVERREAVAAELTGGVVGIGHLVGRLNVIHHSRLIVTFRFG